MWLMSKDTNIMGVIQERMLMSILEFYLFFVMFGTALLKYEKQTILVDLKLLYDSKLVNSKRSYCTKKNYT